MPDPRQVRSMFARIAARYDLLNRLLSLGVDRRWRASLLSQIGNVHGRTAIDVCCGTGDVSLLLARRGASVVAIDFTPEMLRLATAKYARHAKAQTGRITWARADAMALPARNGGADLVTIAFGIRNIENRGGALREFARVLRPGGRLALLEFGMPTDPRLAAAYGLYFRRILPRLGSLVSGDRDAYRYLPDSVAAWPGPAALQLEIEDAGFAECGHCPLSGGIAYLHWGNAPIAPRTTRNGGGSARA